MYGPSEDFPALEFGLSRLRLGAIGEFRCENEGICDFGEFSSSTNHTSLHWPPDPELLWNSRLLSSLCTISEPVGAPFNPLLAGARR